MIEFNKLQFIIEGEPVLDLFSGTGSLAIEALSRGANRVDAVESHPKSLAVIEKNKSLFEIGDELKVYNMDVFRYLKKAESSYPIVLIDPPFTKRIANEVLAALAESKVLAEGTEVFIESSAKESVAEAYGQLERKQHKSFGDKFLSHYIFG